MVHAPRPNVDVFEATIYQFLADGGSGHQGRAGGSVDLFQKSVSEAEGEFGVGLGVFCKFGVVGRGEGHLRTQAPATGRDADGAFGSNVHGIRPERIQPPVHYREGPRGQTNFWIPGEGPGAGVISRAEHFCVVAPCV